MRLGRLSLVSVGLAVLLSGCSGEIARKLPSSASTQVRAEAKLCDRGDLMACHNVALEFDFGEIASESTRTLAKDLYTRACEGGMELSCRRLAELAVVESGGDLLAALPLLQRTCSSGDVDACCDIAEIKIETGRVQDGLSEYLELCHRNSSRACIELGRHTLIGTGGTPDPAGAASILDQHCVNGSPVACYWRAEAFLAQTTSAEDIGREITQLLGQACLGGESLACKRLGGLHLEGVGVERDEEYAQSLLRLACEHSKAEDCNQPIAPPTWPTTEIPAEPEAIAPQEAAPTANP